MNATSHDAITGIVLATVVFGLFILSAILRIRKSWKVLHSETASKWDRMLRRVDLVFSGIFLVASVLFYSIFIANMGR